MGKNLVKKLGFGDMAGLLLVALSVVFSMMLIVPAQTSGASSVSTAVMKTICNIFNTIKEVIFVLGLALMILGGAIYAGANLMPSQSRGGFQGYGMAMIIGGIIGVAIAVAAPFILNTIVSASGASGSYVASGAVAGGGTGGVNGKVSASQICANINGGA
jgi:hypothetical protein